MAVSILQMGPGGSAVLEKRIQRFIYSSCGAAVLAIVPFHLWAQQAAPQKAAPVSKVAAVQKSAPAQAPARKGPPRGPIERYDCKIGTEDQHARIAVLAQGGEVQSVAYYSKWKPRTCSVHLQRGDAFSRWKDTGDATTISTEFGDFLVQVSKTEYQLFFREVDRMHYCGMMGKLNGSMTVTRGAKRQCSVEGIMDRKDSEPADTALTAQPSDTPPPIATITQPGPPLPSEALRLRSADGK